VLGVGKTTAIQHLIAQRPPKEKWAIVVNEFGALGIDGAVLVGPGRCRSPRRRMPRNPRDEGSACVSMTLQVTGVA
jgi:hypothetical protein